jgi:hypothetical protein
MYGTARGLGVYGQEEKRIVAAVYNGQKMTQKKFVKPPKFHTSEESSGPQDSEMVKKLLT